jgi:acetamidase/formamidase
MIEHHLDFARRDTVIGLRHVYQWSKQQVLWHRREWFAPPLDSTDAAVGIDVAAPAKTIAWLTAATSLSQQEVYALCSIVGGFRVSQYSHQLNTVYSAQQPQAMYATIPKAIFDAGTIRRITSSFGAIA